MLRASDRKPQWVRCACGKRAQRVYGTGFLAVRGMGEYKFDPRTNARVGKASRTAKQEEAHYSRVIETQRKIIHERRAAGKEKDGWVHLGVAPAPLVDSINNKEGDKNAVLMDPVPFLKSTGLYMGPEGES